RRLKIRDTIVYECQRLAGRLLRGLENDEPVDLSVFDVAAELGGEPSIPSPVSVGEAAASTPDPASGGDPSSGQPASGPGMLAPSSGVHLDSDTDLAGLQEPMSRRAAAGSNGDALPRGEDSGSQSEEQEDLEDE